MTAAFVKLFMGDNAKLLTEYDSGTDKHTLKVSGLTPPTPSAGLSPWMLIFINLV